jgi:hypothetical protein
MSLRRVGWLAAVAVAALLELSCGQVYRPVVIPISIVPPNPANFHAVFGISANFGFNPGAVLQIDVAGDTDIGQATMGVNPTHAAILSNNSRVFVASAGSQFPGNSDLVTAFFPAVDSPTATGLGTVTTFTLPNVGANQTAGVLSISEAGSLDFRGLDSVFKSPMYEPSTHRLRRQFFHHFGQRDDHPVFQSELRRFAPDYNSRRKRGRSESAVLLLSS